MWVYTSIPLSFKRRKGWGLQSFRTSASKLPHVYLTNMSRYLVVFLITLLFKGFEAKHSVNPTIPKLFDYQQTFQETGEVITHHTTIVDISINGGSLSIHVKDTRPIQGAPNRLTVKLYAMEEYSASGAKLQSIPSSTILNRPVAFHAAHRTRLNHIDSVQQTYELHFPNNRMSFVTDIFTIEDAGASHLPFGGKPSPHYPVNRGDVKLNCTVLNWEFCDQGQNGCAANGSSLHLIFNVTGPELLKSYGSPSTINSTAGYFAASRNVMLDGTPHTLTATQLTLVPLAGKKDQFMLKVILPRFKESASFDPAVSVKGLSDVLQRLASVTGSSTAPKLSPMLALATFSFLIVQLYRY